METVDKFVNKSKSWKDEMKALRSLLLETKLEETFKWNLPCYVHEGRNVVIVQPFKNFLGLMFFDGALLKDPKKILVDNGPNSQAARRFEFRSIDDVVRARTTIKAYVKEAIALAASGRKVEFEKKTPSIPKELKDAFAKNARLKKAFSSLTPGRQRAYILHFTGAKQEATRRARIEKCAPAILAGKGLNDR